MYETVLTTVTQQFNITHNIYFLSNTSYPMTDFLRMEL